MFTAKATNQAIKHCAITTIKAPFLPISLFTAPIAATQGVYKRVKTKNTKELKGVKIVFSVFKFPFIKTVSVLTTLSLAVKPVIRAVDILQSSKPKGLKIGEIKPPRCAKML